MAGSNGNGTQDLATSDRQKLITGAQLSFSGTPRSWQNETQPDDYLSELQNPYTRMEVYEEMRQSDDQVNVAITARLALIRQANWMLATTSDDPAAVEKREFVEDNLFPRLDFLLTKLGEAVQYGFGVVEPVYAWADQPFARYVRRGKIQRFARSGTGRRIYLQKFAHIRQRTIATFLVTEQGEFQGARQETFTGSRYQRVTIPADRLVMWTHDRRGDDYWGVPPTRYAYKAWTMKNQIERLNMLGIDRFGVGTPVGEAGPDWSETEYELLEKYLKAWRAGTSTYLVHPSGGKVEIKAAEGSLFLSALEWVKYYGIAITMQWLSQGNQLSLTSDAGARSLGETFQANAEGVTQADCEEIASLINERIIVPLVDANYGVQEPDAYPVLIPSQRVRQTGAIGSVLQSLIAAKCLHPTPQDEAFIRDQLGLPDIEISTLEQMEEDRKAQAMAIQERAANTEQPDQPTAAALSRRQPGIRRASTYPGEVAAAMPMNVRTDEFSRWEQRVVKPFALSSILDMESVRLTSEVQAVLSEIDAYLEEQVAQLVANGPQNVVEALGELDVPRAYRIRLRKVLLGAAARARDAGQAAVSSEVERQTTPDVAAPARFSRFKALLTRVRSALRTLAQADDTETIRDIRVWAEAERVVEEEISRRVASARSALLAALAAAGLLDAQKFADVARARVRGALEDLSTGRTTDNVAGVVNVGFGVGREEQAEAIRKADPSVFIDKVYSAVMDFASCDECALRDGGVYPIDYDETEPGAIKAPNPRCAGGYNRCRCVWIYRTAEEVPSVVGPTSGPISGPYGGI